MDFTRSSASFFPSAFALNIAIHFLSSLDLDPKTIYLVGQAKKQLQKLDSICLFRLANAASHDIEL